MKSCGCPYSNWNWEKLCEVCTITDKPTNGAVCCDFGYDEECSEYKKRTANPTGEK